MAIAFAQCVVKRMLKISIVESTKQRRLIVEGRISGPWAVELRTACRHRRADLDGRELVVDLKCITAISLEGESVLYELMNEGVKFRGFGVFTKQILKQVARRASRALRETKK
jgi:hypothetical protein